MDIHAYLKRINYQGSLEPTLQTLQQLHESHLLSVPFENLSIYYKQPIILQEQKLYEKIVERRRGGFCFELNGLFAVLLRELGFAVTQISASMAHANGEFGPELDHLTSIVHLEEDWLADVGNGDSFLRPLKLQGERVEHHQSYRLIHDGRYWLVQRHVNDNPWQPEYRFTMQPHELRDFSDRCHYYETSPESPFTRGRTCSLATPEGRITLRDQRLIITRYGQKSEQIVTQEYEKLLAQYFGITTL